jgi:hypothetical protein
MTTCILCVDPEAAAPRKTNGADELIRFEELCHSHQIDYLIAMAQELETPHEEA